MTSRESDVMPLSDFMLASALDSEDLSAREKVDQLILVGQHIGGLLRAGWEQRSDLDETIQGLTTYACMPSLVALAEGRPQTKKVAKAVTKNLRILSSHLLENCVDDIYDTREKESSQHVIGRLSELSVMGALWWGVINGQRNLQCSILPVDRHEDAGKMRDGYNVGIDLVLQENGTRRPIQVKSSLFSTTWDKIETYHPDITILTPSMLVYNGHDFPAKKLMEALVNNDCKALKLANDRADYHFRQTLARSKTHLPAQLQSQA